MNINKLYYYFVLLAAFILPLSRASASIFVAVSIALFLFNIKAYSQYIKFFKEYKLAQALLLLMFYKLISLIWTENIETGLYTKILYIEWIAIFALGFYLKKEQVFSVISAFIAGMFISELISYGMYFHILHLSSARGCDSSHFMISISYSIFLAVVSIFLLNRILSKKYNYKEKIFYLVFFFTATGNLFISNGRTGQLAFFIAFFITFFIHFRLNIKTIIASSIFVSLIIAVAYNTFPNNFANRINLAKRDINYVLHRNYNTSLGLRAAMYIVSYDCFKKEPILGAGIGDYKQAPRYALKNNNHHFAKRVIKFISTHHLHSQFLHEVVSGGLIALFLLLYIYYQLFRLPIENKELKELSVLFGIIYLVGSIPEPLLIKQFPSTLFILFMGLFLAASKRIDFENS